MRCDARYSIRHRESSVGERRLVLGDLAELTVQALNNICRVYDFPNFLRIFEEGAQNFPVFLPALHTGRVLLPPLVSKFASASSNVTAV